MRKMIMRGLAVVAALPFVSDSRFAQQPQKRAPLASRMASERGAIPIYTAVSLADPPGPRSFLAEPQVWHRLPGDSGRPVCKQRDWSSRPVPENQAMIADITAAGRRSDTEGLCVS